MAKSRKQKQGPRSKSKASSDGPDSDRPISIETGARDSPVSINDQILLTQDPDQENMDPVSEINTDIGEERLKEDSVKISGDSDRSSANDTDVSIHQKDHEYIEQIDTKSTVNSEDENKNQNKHINSLLEETIDRNVDQNSDSPYGNKEGTVDAEEVQEIEAIPNTNLLPESGDQDREESQNTEIIDDGTREELHKKDDVNVSQNTDIEGVLSPENIPEIPESITVDEIKENESLSKSGEKIEKLDTSKIQEADNSKDTSYKNEPESKGKEDPQPLSTNQKLPVGWSLQKLGVELPLAESETISCVSAFEANLYIGTSKGQIFHLYIFDDADSYMLISQAQVTTDSKIDKILPVPDAAMCLVLAAKTVHSYTLPELTPCRIGKIKEAEDMSLLSVGKSPAAKLNKSDKVIVYTAAKLRVVQPFPTGIKLLRDINYVGAKRGLSSATGTSAHYSNICLVANEQRYDVVDMQQARKIPLFDYNPASAEGVDPCIVPYLAQDLALPREEYVLAVCTDSQSSMAMFINSDGDVTRGTLPWMDLGYPYTGLAVDWPYLVGAFSHSPDSPQKIVFSSLETLDTVCSLGSENALAEGDKLYGTLAIVNSGTETKIADLGLSHLQSLVSCISREQVSPQKQLTVCKTVFSDGKQLFCLAKTSELESELRHLLTELESPDQFADAIKHGLEFFSKFPTNDSFLHSVFVILLLLAAKFSQVQKIISESHLSENRIDPRLLMLYCVDYSEVNGDLWESFHIEAVFLEIRDRLSEEKIKQNHTFYKWLIREIHTQSETYDEIIRAGIRKLMYTETCESISDVFKMVDSESTAWSGQNEVNDSLLAYFAEKQMFFVLLHIYTIKQTAGNPFEQWALKIIDLSLDLLAGTKKDSCSGITWNGDVITVGTQKFHLPFIAFHELREHVEDETVYTKKLLRLLQLRPENGLALLKSARGNKFASTHKYILNELSKSYKFDSQFSLLKIEYTEQSFLEKSKAQKKVDFDTGTELLADYQDYLNQDDLQVEYENLNILYNTYSVENDLRDPSWPKITWIEYLHLHYRKGDCEEFLKVYLKVYELMVLFTMYQKPFDFNMNSTSGAVEYLNWVFEENADRNKQLREMKDYSTAEWLVFYKHPPVPRTSFLLKDLQMDNLLEYPQPPKEQVKDDLKSLLSFYLELPDNEAKHLSVMHALNAYGNEYLSMDEVLHILPEDFPLMYVQKYMETQVLELENRKSDVQLRKALNKANGKLNKIALRELEATHKQLLNMG